MRWFRWWAAYAAEGTSGRVSAVTMAVLRVRWEVGVGRRTVGRAGPGPPEGARGPRRRWPGRAGGVEPSGPGVGAPMCSVKV
ncbi:hypothetical protein GCM10010329_84600 [Streptomyces spiroverticillatus]|uniref:Uncharacterized protein n=1 Tax=Streptomyces finlayi TaxID=67296 RepID=A0A919CFU6_9ACTN|nr:hypothetical protein GCM10010329_84600 [Streptomyces spiroverticillatus]GHD19354.1 hypothetical protein GCM10010334_82920 [Streptomyces finlayi]